MFQGNSGKKESPTSSQGILNIIGQGTKLTGDLSSNGDIRIDGAIEGQIKVSQRLVIGILVRFWGISNRNLPQLPDT